MHRRGALLLMLMQASLVLMQASLLQAQTPTLQAPNVVPITPQLITSGQPSAAQLAALSAQGIEAVIYLAPPTVGDAVRDEPAILARQGIRYVNIPIPFDSPNETHFDAFAKALDELKGRKVLVHCQVNMRASTLVFLYRTIIGKEAPGPAYESVTRIWQPQGPWRKLVVELLRKHGINFELL